MHVSTGYVLLFVSFIIKALTHNPHGRIQSLFTLYMRRAFHAFHAVACSFMRNLVHSQGAYGCVSMHETEAIPSEIVGAL